MSITISITIPEKLESDLQKAADTIGVSRSRFIGNLLLDWQQKQTDTTNDCEHNTNGNCPVHGINCVAPQSEAVSCPDYRGS